MLMEDFFKTFFSFAVLSSGLIGIMMLAAQIDILIGILLIIISATGIAFSAQILKCFVSLCKYIHKRINLIPPHMNNAFLWIWYGISTLVLVLFTLLFISDIFGLNFTGGTTYINGHFYTGSWEDKVEMTGMYVAVLFFIAIFYVSGYFIAKDFKKDYSLYYKYMDDNQVSLGLFTRPYSSKSNIVLANKYVILEYNISSFVDGSGEIEVTDKIKSSICHIKQSGKKIKSAYALFERLCRNFNYDTKAENIMQNIPKKSNVSITSHYAKVYLDVNSASEAEFTAIPGITIAKAKHAMKVRKEQKLFLNAKQFFNAIDLGEEFIQEVPVSGTKILLNELPMYRISEYKNM